MHLIRDRICVSFASTNYYDDNQTKETLSFWDYFRKSYKCILLVAGLAYASLAAVFNCVHVAHPFTFLFCPFVIALSVFSNVYSENQSNTNMSPKYIWQYTSWKLITSAVLKLWQMFIFILIKDEVLLTVGCPIFPPFYIDSQISVHRKFKKNRSIDIYKRKRNIFQWKIPNSLIIYSMQNRNKLEIKF